MSVCIVHMYNICVYHKLRTGAVIYSKTAHMCTYQPTATLFPEKLSLFNTKI